MSPVGDLPTPILVTGGAGFIGSALVRKLVGDGVFVVNVDKLTYAGNLLNIASVQDSTRHKLVGIDINDGAALTEVFAQFRPAAVMHLAAESHVDRSIDGPAAFIRTNVDGTATLLDVALAYWRVLDGALRERFRFLHVSTDEVYGSLGAEGRFVEDSPYRPSSPYAASKAAADHVVRAYGRTYGLPVLVTNCSNNYGPYQFPEKLIPLMVLNLLNGLPLPVYGTGENVRDWLHVDDHVAGLCAVLTRGRAGETYLMAGNNALRNIDLVSLLCGIMDRLRPTGAPHADAIRFVADRPGHDFRYAIDPGKICAELGWHPAIPFEIGLEETIRWYIDNGDWAAETMKTYGRERLGKWDASPPTSGRTSA